MHSPFGGWRHHLPPHFVVGLWVFSHGAMSLQESIERFILPPEQGEVRRSRIGGGERSEPICRMLIMPYDTESISRNADFISIALRAIPQPSARRAVKLKNPWAEGPSILRTFFHNPFTQPSGQRPVNPHTRQGVSHAPLRTIKNPLNCCLADFMVTQEGFEPPTP